MIVNEWDKVFTAKYGHHFPYNYLTFDTEFTGSNERDDLIMEIGHTMVENGVVVDRLNVILNWYGHPGVTDTWLNYKLNNMRHIVGPGWRLTPDVVQAEGISPIKALKFYHKLFDTWKQRGLPFVAQNGQTADERMLRGNFNRYLNRAFELPPNGYFDTGAIYKATCIWNATEGDAVNFKSSMLPHRTDTLKTYFNRVIHTRVSGVKWGLDLILDHYDLIEKHSVTPEQLHSAGFDSLCLHWIMEEFRSRVHKSNVEENPFKDTEAMQRAFDQESAKYKLTQEAKTKKKAETVPAEAPSTGQVKRTKPGLSQKLRNVRRQRLI
jgi:hypothetical protein